MVKSLLLETIQSIVKSGMDLTFEKAWSPDRMTLSFKMELGEYVGLGSRRYHKECYSGDVSLRDLVMIGEEVLVDALATSAILLKTRMKEVHEREEKGSG